MLSEHDVRAILGTQLPLRRLLLGEEFDTWAAGEELVAKFPLTADDAAKVPLEAAVHPLLRDLLGDIVPAIRGVGEMTAGGFGYIVHERARGIQGQTIDGVAIEPAPGLADDVGAILARIHAVAADRVFALGLGERRLSFRLPELDEVTTTVLSGVVGDRVDAFLRAPPPQPSARRVLCHTDLKGEHVFVGEDRRRVTAVIDWADAEVCDPALDYGGLAIWLGPRFTAAAVASAGEDDETLTERAVWLARAGMIGYWRQVLAGREHAPRDLITAQLRAVFGD